MLKLLYKLFAPYEDYGKDVMPQLLELFIIIILAVIFTFLLYNN